MTNGFETPGMDPTPMGPGASGAAREAVNVPAILLMVVGGLGVLTALWGLVGPQADMSTLLDNPDIPEQYRSLLGSLAGGAGRLFNLIPLLISGLVLFGGVKMRQLESYGLAMAASIAALIPCFGPACICGCLPLGIAAGIWSLVVLNKPEVKAAFH